MAGYVPVILEIRFEDFISIVELGLCAALAARLSLFFAALRQLDQHRHDAHEHALGRPVSGFIQKLEALADIQQRRRLCCRPSRRHVVPALVEFGVLARAFCKIEHDRQRGPRELVGQMAPPTRQSPQ